MSERKGDRKVVCIQYETGKTKTIKKNGRDVTVPDTRLLTVGSAFVTQPNGDADENRWMVQGKFHAVPPNWDGKFVLLDPFTREDEVAG
jgi:hypothetical protein